MKTRTRWLALGMVIMAVVPGALGCTRAIESAYAPAMPRLTQADQLRGVRLGVGRFDDRRSLVEADNPETRTYVARQGAWRFGLTHQGREMIPVSDLVQSVLVEEFTRAGVETVVLPDALAKGAVAAMRSAGERAGAGFVLGGAIVVFEFVNEDKFWYLVSRRSVALEIQLVRVADGELVLDTAATGTDEHDEGMGIRHTTNADRLLNRVLRLVVFRVVEVVAAKLAMAPQDIAIRVAVVERD